MPANLDNSTVTTGLVKVSFHSNPKESENESEVTQSCPTLCDPVDYSLHQAPLSMGFSRPEYWSGFPFLSPGHLPNPGIEPGSPTLEADALTSEPPGKPQRRAMPKNVQTTIQLHSFHMQARLCSKSFKLGFSSMWNKNLKAGFRRGCGTTGLIANICWITEKAREFQKNIYFCFFDYAKAFDCVDHNKIWKILKRLRGTRPPVCESTSSRTRYGTTDWFTVGKGIQQSCISSIAYLTSMQSTSCEMPGWMNYKMNQDCLEKYQ